MKGIEDFSVSKAGNDRTNEDGYLLTNNFALVVDGATSKGMNRYNGKTSGQMARSLILSCVRDFQKDISAGEAFHRMNQSLMNFYLENNLLEELKTAPYKRATASVVVYSRYRNEIWMIGDCQYMLDDELFKDEKEIDIVISNARAAFLEMEIVQGKTLDDLLEFDTGRDFVLPLLKRQYLLQNTLHSQYSYSALDGFPLKESSFIVRKVPPKTKQIVLASDGYPRLFNTLQQSEEALAEIIKKDPLCFREYKSTKGLKKGNISFDDRTYLRFGVN
ncbi:hypothetical protein [Rossellomorea sp. NS-SX7]|uniref:hypothetical protein n=1 Tax=Rossellomorea sp. NS-SX7 TaxID=3463856 RepID=UPI004058C4D9